MRKHTKNIYRRRGRKRRLWRKIRAVFFVLSAIAGIVIVIRMSYAYGYNEALDNTEIIAETYGLADINTIEEYIIDFEGESQEGMPTGCEIASTVSVLNYYGVDITKEYFADNFLPMMSFYQKNGRIYGANPSEKFAGNPYESGSLGCYCEVIEEACLNMQESNYEGADKLEIRAERGIELESLEEYVKDDKPVIIWATSDMEKSYDGFSYYLENDEEYVWRANEHCMVLCGFDEENYFLMDPLKSGKIVAYDKELVKERYEEMGKQAVLIFQTKEK